MKRISQFFRLFYINYVIARHGLDRVVLSVPFFSPVRFLSHLNPFNWWREDKKNYGKSLRLALEDLGPVFVKFGQTLSVRHDIFLKKSF